MTTLNIIKRFKTVFQNPSSLLYFMYGKFEYFPTGLVTNQQTIDLPIYCVSLKQALTRRSFMKKQVDKAGFKNFQFAEGIDGSSLDIALLVEDGSYDDELAKKYHNRSLRSGEIACSLSHGKMYEKIVQEGHPISLILEDDALFITNRINMVNISIFPPNWDIVFLSSFLSTIPPKGHIRGNLFSTESWKGSCAAYLISLKGASKLAKVYKPVFHAADGFVGRCMDYPAEQKHHFKQQGARTKINAYLIYPDCILNGSSVGFWNSTLPVTL
ncbi:MAG: glycosyltransferase family 25 protein [Candidatus Heimdallarchaeota archaeon]